jgi:hypothetical protein
MALRQTERTGGVDFQSGFAETASPRFEALCPAGKGSQKKSVLAEDTLTDPLQMRSGSSLGGSRFKAAFAAAALQVPTPVDNAKQHAREALRRFQVMDDDSLAGTNAVLHFPDSMMSSQAAHTTPHTSQLSASESILEVCLRKTSNAERVSFQQQVALLELALSRNSSPYTPAGTQEMPQMTLVAQEELRAELLTSAAKLQDTYSENKLLRESALHSTREGMVQDATIASLQQEVSSLTLAMASQVCRWAFRRAQAMAFATWPFAVRFLTPAFRAALFTFELFSRRSLSSTWASKLPARLPCRISCSTLKRS